MTGRNEIVVVGGGPIGACAAYFLAADGASVTLLEKEQEVCPPTSGAHANCGLLVPGDVEPLASPGALGKGLRWMRDSSSPLYIAPRPSLDLLRWLWLFRAAASPARARAAAPVLRALHVASAALHDELARDRGERWRFHHDGIVQAYEEPAAMAQACEDADVARGFGVRAEVLAEREVRKRFPGMRGAVAGGIFFPEDGHLDPMLFTREIAGLAAAAGADVCRGAEAIALEPEAGGVRVVTTRGDIVAAQVVLAAGAWTPALTRGLGLRLPIEPAKGASAPQCLHVGSACFGILPGFCSVFRVVSSVINSTTTRTSFFWIVTTPWTCKWGARSPATWKSLPPPKTCSMSATWWHAHPSSIWARRSCFAWDSG